MMKNADDLGTILTAEQGKPLPRQKVKLGTVPHLLNSLPKKQSASMAKQFLDISPTNASWF
jgi:hypothetical protein